MGATSFMVTGTGTTAREAFATERQTACWMHGHGGYTGTIAEKRDFVMIALPSELPATLDNALRFARELIDKGDRRIDNKWGPAGCIAIAKDNWLFFGWASQ